MRAASYNGPARRPNQEPPRSSVKPEAAKVPVNVEGTLCAVQLAKGVPEPGFTKAAVLIDYYQRIAPVMLRTSRTGPLNLKRNRDGVDASFFYRRGPARRAGLGCRT